MPDLVVKEGSVQGKVFRLAGERVSIGRDPSNDMQFEDRTVSRHHALLTVRPDGWYLTDVGSHNSTVVNGAPVVEARLTHNDEVRLGDLVLLFVEHEAAGDQASLSAPVSPAGEITQTIRLGDLGGFRLDTTRALSESVARQRRLGHLLALTELAVSVRTEQALCESVAQILRGTLAADRVIPIIEEDGHSLRPYLESAHDFAEGLEGLGVNASLLHRCRLEGVAATWRGSGPWPNVACAPLRVGSENHGFLYCDRRDPSAEFTSQDLTYLLAVSMQATLAIENIRSYRTVSLRARSLSRQLGERYEMVGQSEAMNSVREFIRKVAPTDAGVLLCGESGTGKELIAWAIHNQSRRAEGPLEIVNCAAVQTALLESELFGHVRGAFTGAVSDKPGRFELADGGTLFLDEVVELPLDCQTKLLRVTEEGRVRRVGDTRDRPVSVRTIAATNRDVSRALAEGRLRPDLFYRLDRLRLEVPPLRERGGDIELLAVRFLAEFSASCNRSVEGFAPEVLQVFRRYRWPGNVRELRNVVERMVLLAKSSVLGCDDVPADLGASAREGGEAAAEPLGEVERKHILRVLQQTGGNKKLAARLLGIDRSTLYARLARYGLRGGSGDAGGAA
jgi:transcriptional regulator with GAF, ATPase, and Fis domain